MCFEPKQETRHLNLSTKIEHLLCLVLEGAGSEEERGHLGRTQGLHVVQPVGRQQQHVARAYAHARENAFFPAARHEVFS